MKLLVIRLQGLQVIKMEKEYSEVCDALGRGVVEKTGAIKDRSGLN